jgi:hypothetical protein
MCTLPMPATPKALVNLARELATAEERGSQARIGQSQNRGKVWEGFFLRYCA